MNDFIWEVEVDRASAPDWSAMLSQFQDANLYQTWSYGAIRWSKANLSHIVLRRGKELVALAQLRIVKPKALRVGVAYLRWGPVCHRIGAELDPDIVRAVAVALKKEYVCNRGLLLKILPNAFIGTERATLFGSCFDGFTQERQTPSNTYRTFVLDLQAPLEEVRRNLDKKWRNQLSRAEKNNLSVEDGTDAADYATFCQIYRQMLNRKKFQTTVDIDEFERIQTDLDPKCRMRVFICKKDGAPVAGMVVSGMGDSGIYVLGATSDDGMNAKGSYLLQWTAIQWLKQIGVRWYDLGGIDPETNPGVYHFKSGLNGKDMIQLVPLIACDNMLSSAAVKAGSALQRVIHGWKVALANSQ